VAMSEKVSYIKTFHSHRVDAHKMHHLSVKSRVNCQHVLTPRLIKLHLPATVA